MVIRRVAMLEPHALWLYASQQLLCCLKQIKKKQKSCAKIFILTQLFVY